MHSSVATREDVTNGGEVGGDDIGLTQDNSGNSQIVENDPKLEEMTGVGSSCIDNNSPAPPAPPSLVCLVDKWKRQLRMFNKEIHNTMST